MKTPYQILGVNKEADDDVIRQAYLSLVKRFPPERFADEFQRIYRAYELLKTEEDRQAYRLFHCELPEPAEIAALLVPGENEKIPRSTEAFQQRLSRDLKQFCAGFRL